MRVLHLTRGTFQEFQLLEAVDSTSDYLKQYLDRGRPRIAMAREQTAGRGREDRRWLSPRDQGIYISFLFYPAWSSRRASILNTVGVLAVLESLRSVVPAETSVHAKAPNDVLIGGRKVAGILVELGSLGSEIKWAIIGIGINVFQTEFPGLGRPHVSPTSLYLEGAAPESLDSVCRPLIRWFTHYLRAAQEGQGGELARQFADELNASP